MASAPRRRFYKDVSVTDDLQVTLDGKPIRTPAKAPLRLPTRALAEAIAEEWREQGEILKPEGMILAKLANTAIDRVAPDRGRIVEETVKFAGSDLVCYRAGEPEGLAGRQRDAWDPVIAWANARLDASFIATKGIMHRPQSEATLAAFGQYVASQDDWTLTALHNMATLTGSALISTMCLAGALEPTSAWQSAHVDEDWQISQWGEDAEAAARRARLRVEFDACYRFNLLSHAGT